MSRYTLEEIIAKFEADDFFAVESIYPKKKKTDFNFVYIGFKPTEKLKEFFMRAHGMAPDDNETFRSLFSTYYKEGNEKLRKFANQSDNVSYNNVTRESSAYLTVYHTDEFNPHSYMKGRENIPEGFRLI